MDPLDEADDAAANPMAIVMDAGAKAIMAGLAGDKEEEQKQLLRARAAYKKMRNAQIEAIVDNLDRECFDQQEERPRKMRPATTNLGDLLRNAGVTADEGEER